jgi:hypothetical protein
LSFQWEPLCVDARQLVLSKLSLRELARTARTCKEFRQASLTRAAEERAKLIALGKETYGQGVFSCMVRALQASLLGLDACPGLAITGGPLAFINADGIVDILNQEEAAERRRG